MCCNEPGYYFGIRHNSGKIGSQCENCYGADLLEIVVSGGCPPFTWSVAGGALIFDILTTSDRVNILRIYDYNTPTEPNGDLVTVIDSCGESATCLVRTCPECGGSGDGDGGGGGPQACVTEEYITPIVAMVEGPFTGRQVFNIFVHQVLSRESALIDSFIGEWENDSYDLSGTIFYSDGTSETLSVVVSKYNSDYDRLVVAPEHNLSTFENAILMVHPSLPCGCGSVALYLIDGGVPPYTASVLVGSESVVLVSGLYSPYFGGPAYGGDCDGATTISVEDLCENSFDLPLEEYETETEGTIWLSPGDPTVENIEKSCTDTASIGITLSYDLCIKDVYLEGDERNLGELIVNYSEDEIACVDENQEETTQDFTFPTSAVWVSALGTCCGGSIDIINLWLCAPGSANRKLLDSKTITVQSVTAMTWALSPATLPTGITIPDDTGKFTVTGGTPPYTWEIIDVDVGRHQNISLRYNVTTGVSNWVGTDGGGCGTFIVRCTDACGTLDTYVGVISGGAWYPWLEASVFAMASFRAIFLPPPVGGWVPMSGDESDGPQCRSLLEQYSGPDDGEGANRYWFAHTYPNFKNGGYTDDQATQGREVWYRQKINNMFLFTEILVYDNQASGTCAGYAPKPAWCWCDSWWPLDDAKCQDRVAAVGASNVYGCHFNEAVWSNAINVGGWNDWYMRSGQRGILLSEETSNTFIQGTSGYYTVLESTPYGDGSVICLWKPNVFAAERSHTHWIAGYHVYVYGC